MPANRTFLGLPIAEHDPNAYSDEQRKADLLRTMTHMVPVAIPQKLIRVGGNEDGAYLIPDDLHGIEACFSPGVDNRKRFEDELSLKFGMKVHMCDYSSDVNKFSTPLIPGLQTFRKCWLDITKAEDAVSLDEWVREYEHRGDLMLQMDIEGAEYRNVLACSMSILSRFRIIIFEIHELQFLSDPSVFYSVLSPFFEKLGSAFVCAHAHPNNYEGTFLLPYLNTVVPNVMELTYIRKDRLLRSRENITPQIPHPLDIVNSIAQSQIVLDDFWLCGRERSLPSSLKIASDKIAHLEFAIGQITTNMQAGLEALANTTANAILHAKGKRIETFSLEKNAPPGNEIARGKPYLLSSAYGVFKKNGAIPADGVEDYFFHTNIGPNESISIDLGKVYENVALSITNRRDACRDRARCLFVTFSETEDAKDQDVLPLPLTTEFLSGIAPLAIRFEEAIRGRYVKIYSPIITALHFNRVQIYAK